MSKRGPSGWRTTAESRRIRAKQARGVSTGRSAPSSFLPRARNPCTKKGTKASSRSPPSSKIFQEDHRRRNAFRLWRALLHLTNFMVKRAPQPTISTRDPLYEDRLCENPLCPLYTHVYIYVRQSMRFIEKQEERVGGDVKA